MSLTDLLASSKVCSNKFEIKVIVGNSLTGKSLTNLLHWIGKCY